MADINGVAFRQQMKRIVHRFRGEEVPIYTAAVINGSGNGRGLGYIEDLLYATGSSAKFGLALEVKLRTARTDEPGTVFLGDINPNNLPGPNKYRLTYFFQEPAFVENALGGLRSTYGDTIDAVTLRGFPWNRVDPRFENQRSQGNHAFIPSLSGVGLLDRDINNNASWSTSVGTEGKCVVGPTCMFDEFRAPIMNQEHVTVTRENKRWFLELIRTRRGPPPLPPTPSGPDLRFNSNGSCDGEDLKFSITNVGGEIVNNGIGQVFFSPRNKQLKVLCEVFEPGRETVTLRTVGEVANEATCRAALELAGIPVGLLQRE